MFAKYVLKVHFSPLKQITFGIFFEKKEKWYSKTFFKILFKFFNFDLFMISFCLSFVVKGASFIRVYFFLIGKYLWKTERIASLNLFILFLSNQKVFVSAWKLSLSIFHWDGKVTFDP